MSGDERRLAASLESAVKLGRHHDAITSVPQSMG